MQYLSKTCFKCILGEWAYRENTIKPLLKVSRNPLVAPIPLNTIWYKVKVERNDLTDFRLIRGSSWVDLTPTGDMHFAHLLFDYLIKYSIDTLRPNPNANEQSREERFKTLIRSMIPLRRSLPSLANLTLILVSTSKGGPFTIIEGNHTALAMYFEHFVNKPKLQYPVQFAYVGVNPKMFEYTFYHIA